MRTLIFLPVVLFIAFSFKSEPISVNAALQVSSVNFITGNIDDAVKKATAESKNIFVFAYAEWSGPCKRMVSTTFSNEAVVKQLNANYVNIKIECEDADAVSSADGKLFIEKYNIKNYPVVIIMDSKGKVLKSSLSIKDDAQLLEFLK